MTAKDDKKKFPFTMERLAKLPVPSRGRVRYRDAGQPGLCLYVTAAGGKTFYLYRSVEGKPSEEKLGGFPDLTVKGARDAAADKIAKQAKGVDLGEERRARRNRKTLRDLFNHWLVGAKLRKKTWRDDERQFKKYLADLADMPLVKITTEVVTDKHNQIAEKHGPIQANRTRALWSALYGKDGSGAKPLGYTGGNPVSAVRKFKERSRERYLLPDELRRFFVAVESEYPPWRDFFLLCLVAGARRGNVSAMEWREIDLTGATWHIPGHKTKTGDPIPVVLPAPAVRILEDRRPFTEATGYVFPSSSASGHVEDPRKAWERIRTASGLDDLRMHDLRRSLGSWQAAGGASLQVIGQSLGHRDPKATAVYSRLQLDPVRASVESAVAAMQLAGNGAAKMIEAQPQPEKG